MNERMNEEASIQIVVPFHYYVRICAVGLRAKREVT